MRRFLILTLMAGLLAGCAPWLGLEKVSIGMTKAEVLAQLGTPTDVAGSGKFFMSGSTDFSQPNRSSGAGPGGGAAQSPELRPEASRADHAGRSGGTRSRRGSCTPFSPPPASPPVTPSSARGTATRTSTSNALSNCCRVSVSSLSCSRSRACTSSMRTRCRRSYAWTRPWNGPIVHVSRAVVDGAWYKEQFIPVVQQRGAAIIKARGASSAASAASAAIDHIHTWVKGTPDGDWVSMAVPSDGSYGIPAGVIYGYPVTCANGDYQVVQGLAINDFSRGKMDATYKELLEERDGVKDLI